MPKPNTLPSRDAVLQRAVELHALDTILPFSHRDQQSSLLTDEDVATLKEGMAPTRYRLAAALAGTGKPCVEFAVHHLWDPEERAWIPPMVCRPRSRQNCALRVCAELSAHILAGSNHRVDDRTCDSPWCSLLEEDGRDRVID